MSLKVFFNECSEWIEDDVKSGLKMYEKNEKYNKKISKEAVFLITNFQSINFIVVVSFRNFLGSKLHSVNEFPNVN